MKPKKPQKPAKAPKRRGPKVGGTFNASVTKARHDAVMFVLRNNPDGVGMAALIKHLKDMPSGRPNGKVPTDGSLRTYLGLLFAKMQKEGTVAVCGGVGRATLYALVDHSPCREGANA